MAVLAEHLVGRAAELGEIDRALAELERGRPAALELVGEPGIGKSRLIDELIARADARGHLVLAGSASELERDLPFRVFVDAIDEYLQGLEPRRREALDDEIRSALAPVFPSLSRFAAPGESTHQHERYRSHRAVRELLERMTATTPLVLVLDDIHWADPASVDLLGSLLRRAPDAAVLIALAVRPGQGLERLSPALEPARGTGTIVRVELDVLTRGEAGELLGEDVDEPTAALLYEASGGNPFYLEQLARSLERMSALAAATPESLPADLHVPPLVAAALAEELALLPDDARVLLQGAAVAGDLFDPELAGGAAAIDGTLALDAVDELLRRGLIRETDVPRRFRFRHPLVRRAVYESAPAAWRLGAHERSAKALAARGALAAEQAHHVERSARHGDLAAVAILREAGEEAAYRAPASAARWFAAAVRLLPESAPAEERVELLLARAGALTATGQFAESHDALLESISLAPEGALALQTRLTTACAGVEHLLGDHEKAHARLARALSRLPDPRSPEAVALMIELAVDGLYRMEYESMRAWARRASDAARPLGISPLTAAAVAVLTLAVAFTGASAEAETYRLEAAALVDDLSDVELALRLDAAANLAASELYLDRYPEAGAHAERAMAVGLATDQASIVPFVSPVLGTVYVFRGRLTEAAELLDGAVEATRLSGNVQGLAWNLLNRSFAALVAGDVETALATAHESMELAGELDQSLVSAWAGSVLAGALFEAGEPRRAVETLVGAAGGEELRFIPGFWKVNRLELLTRCWLALDEPGEAAHAAARAATYAAVFGLPSAAAMAHRAAAAVSLASHDTAAAVERALASTMAAEEVGAPVEAAVSRVLVGRALAEQRQTERAVAELERAAAELHAYGALRHRAAAERELRRLGHRIHRRSRPGHAAGVGVETLTGRELQVARLVVDRKTNPQIAEELFLSPKTVETHMRNTFRKLGVSSRVDVARHVERADRLRAPSL
jgi:ATP/maltotriose-dependent transcriptional regulator MalT